MIMFNRQSSIQHYWQQMSSSSASASVAVGGSGSAVWARVRLADRRDVPNIHRMIRQMAEFELLTDLFSATESSHSSSLFPASDAPPPFHSVTVLILELSPDPIPDHDTGGGFIPTVRRVELGYPVEDPEAEEFRSPFEGATVAGFVLCFPNYSSFLAKAGLYVENLFVRAAWRRRGLGRMLLSVVAAEAARMGMGRVEWIVLDWNANAISFYQEMGAEMLPQWRICRLAGPALQAFRN